ncbi:hypothetical protein [Phenylobacterium sp.]|uniref:hypothetical protein n=1 Tax=Phenylobacterium sp. TaxID=1871053 RepID=UPI0035AEA0B1
MGARRPKALFASRPDDVLQLTSGGCDYECGSLWGLWKTNFERRGLNAPPRTATISPEFSIQLELPDEDMGIAAAGRVERGGTLTITPTSRSRS